MELTRFLAVVRSRAWTMVLAAVVAAIIGYVVSSSQPRTYETSSRIVVDAGLGTTGTGTDSVLAAPAIAQTYATLATTRTLTDPIVTDLRLPYDAKGLSDRLVARAEFDSPFIVITMRDQDAKRAADVANGLAEALVKSAQPSGSSASQEPLLTIVERAQTPTDTVAPRVLFNTSLAAALGFILALAAIIILAYLDDRIQRSADIEATGLPVLGDVHLTNYVGFDGAPLVEHAVDSSGAVFDGLVRRFGGNMKVVLVTAPRTGICELLAGLGLARAAARAGRRTVLIDANVREPRLDRLLDLPNEPGLATMLGAPRSSPLRLMQTTAVPRLQVITAGEVMNVHEDVVASSRLTEILQDLGVLVDVIVVVGPALSAGRDAAVLAAVSDVVVLVAELKATTLRQVRASIRSLRDVGGQVLGVLIATPPAGRAVFLPTVAPRPRDESAGIQ